MARFLIFLLGFSFTLNSSFGQEIEIQSDSTDQIPVSINIVDIVNEIQEANNDLKIIKRKAEPTNELKKIDSLFKDYKIFISKQENLTKAFTETNPNSLKIDNRIKKWGSYKTKLVNWGATIESYNAANSKLIDELNEKITTWNLTYVDARDNNAPQELLSYVNSIRDSLHLANKMIIRSTSKYLRLQTKIAKLSETVEESRNTLIKFKRSDQYGIFFKRHQVIWKPKDVDYETNDDGKESFSSYKTALINFGDFIISKPEIIMQFLFYLLLIFLALRYLKKGFEKYPLDENNSRLKRYENLLTKQNTLILVFSALILLRYFLIGNERLFVDIILVLIMLTIIPIIKPYEPNFFRNFFYLLTGLFVLDSFKTYAWFSSLDYRLYQFFELILLLALVLFYSRPILFKSNTRELKRFSRIFQKLRLYLLSALILAFLANVFGYTNLTDLVLIITIQSGIVSAYAYAVLLIAESAAVSLIYRHYQNRIVKNINEQIEVEQKLKKIVRIIIGILWAIVFLSIIGRLEDFTAYLQIILSEKYTIGNISFTIGAILSFFLVLFMSYFLSRLAAFLINDGNGALKVFNFSKGVPTAISVVTRYIIIGFGFIFAISILGIDLSTFNLMAGALGLGIGFGLQTIISNFVSGLILIFERPILPGDSVEVNNLWGTVSRIGVRASVINTYDGAEVIVPNNSLITNDLINWTLSSKIRRMEVAIGTAYGSDPNEVLKILKESAKAHPAVLKNPEPLPLFKGFGDSSLDFTIWFWVFFENGLSSKSEISIDIYNRLAAANIEIPFPQRDVHIKSLSKGSDKPNEGIGFKNEPEL